MVCIFLFLKSTVTDFCENIENIKTGRAGCPGSVQFDFNVQLLVGRSGHTISLKGVVSIDLLVD